MELWSLQQMVEWGGFLLRYNGLNRHAAVPPYHQHYWKNLYKKC